MLLHRGICTFGALSLLVTILNLYISARLRMHACSAYEPRPHLSVDLYGGYNYLASAEW